MRIRTTAIQAGMTVLAHVHSHAVEPLTVTNVRWGASEYGWITGTDGNGATATIRVRDCGSVEVVEG